MSDVLHDIRLFLRERGSLNDLTPFRDDDSLTDTGVIDSIVLIQLVDFLETKYGIEIPLEMVTQDNFDTLDAIDRTVMSLKSG
jgi:acyl carrier protein